MKIIISNLVLVLLLIPGFGTNLSALDESIMTLYGHTRAVYSIAYSPDGTKIASGSWDRTIKIWRVPTTDINEKENSNGKKTGIINVIPNPVNENAKIIYSLAHAGNVSISIKNVLGEDIQNLEEVGYLSSREYSFDFETNNLPPGIYYCIMKTENNIITKSFVIIR
jgi:WD40 repeat protein